jgi:hypothetical protein
MPVDKINTQTDLVMLNFFPIVPIDPTFLVYRRRVEGEAPKGELEDGIHLFKMPSNDYVGDIRNSFEAYYVSFEPRSGFTEIDLNAKRVPGIAKDYLFWSLRSECSTRLDPSQYEVNDSFRRRVHFVMHTDDFGKELVWLEPYYFRSASRIGLLSGFEFSKNPEKSMDREVLRRGLSLDSHYRENRSFYIDHLSKLYSFYSKFHDALFPLTSKGIALDIAWPPISAKSTRLEKKQYLFSGGHSSPSQFLGVRTYGPYRALSSRPILCFVYRDQDKTLAYDLYYALNGRTYPTTFPGMSKMFSIDLDPTRIKGASIRDFGPESVEKVAAELSANFGESPFLPIIAFPWSRLDLTAEAEKAYYSVKYTFLKKRIATQFVSLDMLRNKEALKWATSNIGLAVFSKLGGIPWQLSPKSAPCLIVGVGQAHRKDAAGRIRRYFAYSVLTDSTGVYQRIKVLSENENEDAYLGGLAKSLVSLLSEYSADYKRIALHTTFALRRKEMAAIYDALRGFAGSNSPLLLAVLKFDEKSKFMGFAIWNNSRVPYESTVVPISEDEYLIWFEGLQYGKPMVTRRIGRPMYVNFTYSSRSLGPQEKSQLLQDSMNLAGANWRGFNAKSMPISVYYAKLIAQYIGSFDKLNLGEIEIENLPPWFL